MPETPFSSLRDSRRDWLMRCGIGAFGWNLWQTLRARAETAHAREIAPRACIFVFLYGGPSHLETFDPKPAAPAEIRGEFQPIATSAPGVMIGEHLPHLARVMDRVALVRSMHHTNRLHDSASIETFTGRQAAQGDREEFAPIPQFFPCHGAVVNQLRTHRQCDVPHALLPWIFHNVIDVPCQGGGFLGTAFDPFGIEGDLNSNSFNARLLQRPDTLPGERVLSRKELLSVLDRNASIPEADARRLERLYERAYSLLDSQHLRDALRIDREDAATRRRYGLDEASDSGEVVTPITRLKNLRGQSLLQARRLVEAGVPFVNVNDFRQQGQNWDSHAQNFEQHRRHLLPAVDRGLATLIADLDERGLLETTLVVALGEFGRTPVINGNAGRDHWPDCYSILLAGGGIRGGAVLGASDAHGAYPDRDPVTPGDLAATIYAHFGLDPATEIHDHTGRPWRIAEGRPLLSLFG